MKIFNRICASISKFFEFDFEDDIELCIHTYVYAIDDTDPEIYQEIKYNGYLVWKYQLV